MIKYRDRLDIIADVLKVVKNGAKKTRIMYMANLSYTLLTRYLTDVIEKGLVRIEDGKTYELTEKGSKFLQEFTSYRKHEMKVKERVNIIQDEKVTLVNRFLNIEDANVNLENYQNKKREYASKKE